MDARWIIYGNVLWMCFKYNELYIVTWNMLNFYGTGALK
jgi:hypothetical protein